MARTTALTMARPRPRRSKMLSTDGRPRVRATAAMKKMTAAASQRPSSVRATCRVSAVEDPDGRSNDPKVSAIAPVTNAAADAGIQSIRMGTP